MQEKELVKRAAQKAGISVEQAAFITSHFWLTIRNILSNPKDIQDNGIQLHNFLTIRLKRLRVLYEADKIVKGRSELNKENQEVVLEMYKKLRTYISSKHKDSIDDFLTK